MVFIWYDDARMIHGDFRDADMEEKMLVEEERISSEKDIHCRGVGGITILTAHVLDKASRHCHNP
jgi:hypothetical protein